MFVMTYLVAVYFAARNKEDVIEGFFAGQFVTFSSWKKIPITPLEVILFLHFVVLIITKEKISLR